MSETTHTEPNYMGVFWWLLVLTIAGDRRDLHAHCQNRGCNPSRLDGDIQSGAGRALLYAS